MGIGGASPISLLLILGISIYFSFFGFLSFFSFPVLGQTMGVLLVLFPTLVYLNNVLFYYAINDAGYPSFPNFLKVEDWFLDSLRILLVILICFCISLQYWSEGGNSKFS